MDKRKFFLVAGIGCGLLVVLLVFVIPVSLFSFSQIRQSSNQSVGVIPVSGSSEQSQIATLPSGAVVDNETGVLMQEEADTLVDLYNEVAPGVVNIQVIVVQGGQVGASAGSGFILDEQGHIVTNNHVVQGESNITVVFHNGFEARAEVVGTDDDSDLAIIRVDGLPDGVHPLELADSDAVQVGEWVVAIGNPFGLGSSLSVGVISAMGRTIDSGATPFSIPQAIQTDAAINPGNSGGPLMNLAGQVIGVNAQIATSGERANSGVGFAIPANVVRKIAPVLIAEGQYEWPFIGLRGDDVSLLVAEGNELESQEGAYIHIVTEGGPAQAAGIQGSTGSVEVDGFPVPVGGDVIVDVDGETITSFDDLLVTIANHDVGDTVTLGVIRGGQRVEVDVTLQGRPQAFE